MDKLPYSIREINALPRPERVAIYQQLIPDWVFERYRIDPETLLQDGQQVIRVRCPDNSRSMEISVRHHPYELDPLMYLNLIDTFTNQLMVLLLVISDPESTRYNIDVDLEGHPTHFGTSSRNLPQELRSMEAGLSPGQVRRGLRSFRMSLPIFEAFVSRMGHPLFMIEPLFYHNAIIFERYGFSYTYGKRDMEWINQEFAEGGELYARLDDSPFRKVEQAKTVRGRSWAIHDGILGHSFTGFQMYKRVGEHAQVNTFPNSLW